MISFSASVISTSSPLLISTAIGVLLIDKGGVELRDGQPLESVAARGVPARVSLADAGDARGSFDALPLMI